MYWCKICVKNYKLLKARVWKNKRDMRKGYKTAIKRKTKEIQNWGESAGDWKKGALAAASL